MNELQELLRRLESNEPGRLCEYGVILEYVKDRIKELRRQQRKATARPDNLLNTEVLTDLAAAVRTAKTVRNNQPHKREPHTDEYGYES